MDIKTIVGYIAGCLTAFAAAPQVYKIWKDKAAKDVSFKTFFILSLGLSLWIVYGLLVNEMPIVITNAISLILNLSVLILQKHFSNKS